MALWSSIAAMINAVVTVLLGPGILTHEYAHVLACRLHGIEVTDPPSLGLFESTASMEHEPVDTFGQDLSIATAPFFVNSVLALSAFALAVALPDPLDTATLWLGITFGITSLPSPGDTETLLRGVGTIPWPAKALGYLLAVPTRVASVSLVLAGVLGALWTGYLYVFVTPV